MELKPIDVDDNNALKKSFIKFLIETKEGMKIIRDYYVPDDFDNEGKIYCSFDNFIETFYLRDGLRLNIIPKQNAIDYLKNLELEGKPSIVTLIKL